MAKRKYKIVETRESVSLWVSTRKKWHKGDRLLFWYRVREVELKSNMHAELESARMTIADELKDLTTYPASLLDALPDGVVK